VGGWGGECEVVRGGGWGGVGAGKRGGGVCCTQYLHRNGGVIVVGIPQHHVLPSHYHPMHYSIYKILHRINAYCI